MTNLVTDAHSPTAQAWGHRPAGVGEEQAGGGQRGPEGRGGWAGCFPGGATWQGPPPSRNPGGVVAAALEPEPSPERGLRGEPGPGAGGPQGVGPLIPRWGLSLLGCGLWGQLLGNL